MENKTVQKHFFKLALTAQELGFFPTNTLEWPAPTVEWIQHLHEHREKTKDPSTLADILSVTTFPASLTEDQFETIWKLIKRLRQETTSFLMTKVVLAKQPQRIWEKFGFILPESMNVILERIMTRVTQGFSNSKVDTEVMMTEILKDIQGEFAACMENGEIKEQDIDETIAAIRNGTKSLKDKIPEQYQGMVDMMSNATEEKGTDVNEIATLLTEFVKFTKDVQDNKIPQGAHPFMKKIMKKAMSTMSGNGKAKESVRERLRRQFLAKSKDAEQKANEE